MKKKTAVGKKTIRVASLFSGCGGMDLGFEAEDFNIVWANDINHWACETYRRNLGNYIIEGNIADLDLEALPDCDLILGGFPCQDFSMIWKRGGINTARGNLYRYFAEAIHKKEPKVFIAENVKGLLSANNGEAIKRIIDDFEKTGKYGYRTKPYLINFANYGVPQLRERVLIVGVRKDIADELDIPRPTHDSSSYVSAAEALKGVESVPQNNEHQNVLKRTIERLKLIPPGGNFSDIPRSSPFYVKGMISHVYRRLHPDRPSTTIIAGGGGGTWGYHYS